MPYQAHAACCKRSKVEECDRRAGDPSALVGSCAKAREILGWQPQYTKIEEVIAHAWQWHQKRHG